MAKLNVTRISWQKLTLELLVVFLGVTGGFLLNNWREGRKEVHLERKYIESFIQNVDSNIVELEWNISEDTPWLERTKSYIDAMLNNQLHSDSIGSVFSMIVSVSNIDMPANTFEDIKSSGNLNLIRDYHIKEKIVAYHKDIDGIKYVDKYYNNYFSDYSLPFVFENFDLLNVDFIDKDKKRPIQFFSIVNGCYSIRSQRNQALKEFLVTSKTFKQELEEYLETEF